MYKITIARFMKSLQLKAKQTAHLLPYDVKIAHLSKHGHIELLPQPQLV